MTLSQTLPPARFLKTLEFSLPLISASPVAQATGGISAAGTFYDSSTVVTTAATSYNNWQLGIGFGVTVENKTPSVVSISSGGLVERITDGNAIISSSRGSASNTLRLSVTESGGQTVTAFNGYTDGTVSANLADSITALFSAGGTNPLYSTFTHDSATYVKSASCWAKDLSLSGLAVAFAPNGASWSQANSPVLITPRHAVMCRHYSSALPVKGVSKARFFGTDGVVYEATVAGVSDPMLSGGLSDDLLVVTFASSLPDDVAPFDVAGEWMRQGVTDTGRNAQYPGEAYAGGYGFAVNQNYHAVGVSFGSTVGLYQSSVLRAVSYNGNNLGALVCSIRFLLGGPAMTAAGGALDSYSGFLVSAATGDSGKPVFAVVGGTPALVAVFSYVDLGPFVGTGDGAMVDALIVNADADAGISTGLTVTVAPDPTL